MAKFQMAFVAAAALGVAACAPQSVVERTDARTERAQQRTALVPLLDNTGTVVTFVPESEVRGAATGTPFAINRGGQLMTLTVGPRQSEGVSAGAARVIGVDGNGNPVVMHEGPGRGDLSPAGIPVVTGTDSDGRPVIQFMTAAQAAAFQRQAAGGAPRGQRTPTALPGTGTTATTPPGSQIR
ncbi:MAG: hypothetical protein MUC64_06075 [Rubritepida sp.]|jgi:hypothetical protein|nr:hypothetical protein [Rubritepida sp.]